ncbi:MAG: SufD family Fe-S cluster assembly protein [Alphaproteobacteria bacterium]|nr:MAG: SufD family Fe-S cluster assembly protein [Alphaproteobacteria bacterium]
MSAATITTLARTPPFAMPHPKDEAWRYSDRATLARVQDLAARRAAPVARRLADGARVEARLCADGGAVHHAETVTVAARGTATLVHRLAGAGWTNAAIDIALKDACLNHVVIQEADDAAAVTASVTARLEAGARYNLFVLHQGAKFGRVALDATLAGADAAFDLAAVQLARGKQVVETVSHTRHRVPHTQSNQIVRSVVGARASANYLGKIVVEKGAQKTDASQNARALLLNRTATANTKPELEIYADDVKCAHGAAVGALDEAALFYLMSRGIGPGQARAMLIEGFIADIIGAVADERAQALIHAKASAWLHAGEEEVA